jgi:hypothetical protein
MLLEIGLTNARNEREREKLGRLGYLSHAPFTQAMPCKTTQGDDSMGHNVFISYATKDKDTALRVYDGLNKRGLTCWISCKDIPAGGNYQNEIVNALRAARVMVLVFSSNANSSGEIQKELALAGQYQLTVMPLKIEDVVPTGGFILNLATSQWVEIFPDFEKSLDEVATTIRTITDMSDKFTLRVREASETDGVIGSHDRKILEADATSLGLSPYQATLIINEVVGGSTRLNTQERELEYLQFIADVLADGKISSIGKKWLADKAKLLDISDSRAHALLEQEKAILGLSDISTPAALPSATTVEFVAEATDRSYWENRDRPKTIKMADTILEICKAFDSSLALKYNKYYIGFSRDGIPFNFTTCTPRKSAMNFSLKIPRSEEIDAKLEQSGLNLREYVHGRYRIKLEPEDLDKHRPLIEELLKTAYENH